MVLLQLSDRSGKTQKLNHLPGFRSAGSLGLPFLESLFQFLNHRFISD